MSLGVPHPQWLGSAPFRNPGNILINRHYYYSNTSIVGCFLLSLFAMQLLQLVLLSVNSLLWAGSCLTSTLTDNNVLLCYTVLHCLVYTYWCFYCVCFTDQLVNFMMIIKYRSHPHYWMYYWQELLITGRNNQIIQTIRFYQNGNNNNTFAMIYSKQDNISLCC